MRKGFQAPFHLGRVGTSGHHKPAHVSFFTEDWEAWMWNWVSLEFPLTRYFKDSGKKCWCVWGFYEEVLSSLKDWILQLWRFEHAVFFDQIFGQECWGQNVDHVVSRRSIGWPTMHNVPYAAFSWRSIGRATHTQEFLPPPPCVLKCPIYFYAL